MPRRTHRTHRLTDQQFIEMVLRGETVPCAFPRKNGGFHFVCLRPQSVRMAQEPYTYRTEPGRWLASAHSAGLCPAIRVDFPGVVYVAWSNETERTAREYAREVASGP